MLAGCSSAAPLQLAEVRGKVTLDGAPLSGAIVTFYPETDATESPPHSRGTTDAAGFYQLELATGGGKTGAVIGKSRVVVRWPRDRQDSPEAARPTIPLRYTVANDTPLRVEVKAGGPQTIDLALKGKAP
jgi:hypothetical protein